MELVVGASDATMKTILGKLGSLLAQEYSLIKGVRGDIQYINDELASMQAFLRDHSSGTEDQDHRMKDWMKQIRDMAYDSKDCIDDFAHRLPHDSISHPRCCSWSWILKITYDVSTWLPRRQIASNIAELKVRAQLIAERRTRYGVENPSKGNDKSSTSRANMHDIAENQVASRQLIGMKEPVGMVTDMEKLEKWLSMSTEKIADEHTSDPQTRSDENKRDPYKSAVLSIVGFGGVGKTTIATALYQKVRNEFECRASVTVSQSYDENAVLTSILDQIMPHDRDPVQQGSETGSLEEKKNVAHVTSTLKGVVPLIRRCMAPIDEGTSDVKQSKMEEAKNKQLKKLKEYLNEKRYLLLVDDIWSTNTWQSIRKWFPENNNKGSRIIVTTRFQAVGAACSQTDGINLLHSVGFLSDKKSKRLFEQSVDESRSSKHSKQVPKEAQEVWRICGGLPLVIVIMAGLVACNPNKPIGDWEKFCKSLFPDKVSSLTLDGVTRVLDCCYNDLPGDLKTCSLYLSIFPKGWQISRKCLTRRWIAEGYVSEKQGLSEEEVAETYFNQLLRRKLIRPVEHSSNGKIKTFQVHDMVLEYIVSKASEENFITVVGGHWMMPLPSNKVRRLSMQSSSSKHEDSTKGMNLAQVRSLTVFGSLTQLRFEAFNNRIIQVLDLDGWKGLRDKHLDDICKMLVLKYLSLRRTNIKKIPSKIEKLQYLETLDLRETNVQELPKAVEELKLISSILGGSKNPRKGLMLPKKKTKDARKIKARNKDRMKGIRVLSGIEIVGESTELECLNQMTGLKKLAIYKLSIENYGDTFTELLSSIEYLCSCGLLTLAINDENSNFINSLDKMSAPPRYLVALELSGNLEKAPEWITNLHTLNKLTLSMTVLRTDTLMLLRGLPELFSLTFSLSAAIEGKKIEKILDTNKSKSGGEIIVPGGFPRLKLLRLFAPRVPKLGFSYNAMPALEMIEMRFDAFEGIFGMETLQSVQGVHLRVNGHQEDETTKFFLDDLKSNIMGPKVLVDHITAA